MNTTPRSSQGFTHIGKIAPQPPTKKPPAHQWQDFALSVIEKLAIPTNKRSAVFKVCKEYPRPIIEKCLSDTLELVNTGEPWRYFFKLIAKLPPPTS